MIDHIGYESDKCLIWPFLRSKNGYAIIPVADTVKRVTRLLLFATKGRNPSKEKCLALHSCGNGQLGCVNPNHLYWGSYKDNAKDREVHKKNGKMAIDIL